MPEEKDSDFTWDEFVAKINNVLNANLGNFVHRVLTLELVCPLSRAARRLQFDAHPSTKRSRGGEEALFEEITSTRNPTSIEMHSKASWPWNTSLQPNPSGRRSMETLQKIAGSARQSGPPWFAGIARFLAITMQPFMPTSAQQLWVNLATRSSCRSTMERRHRLVCAASGEMSHQHRCLSGLIRQDFGHREKLVDDSPKDDGVHSVKGKKRKEEKHEN